MNLYPSHTTALAIWRSWSAQEAIPLHVFHDIRSASTSLTPANLLPTSSTLKAPASSHDEVGELIAELPLQAGDPPFHILTPRTTGSRPCNSVVRHRTQLTYPVRSFLCVAPHIYACSPELVFVQMAERLSFGELVALGYELCGCYPLPVRRGAMVRRPLTTPGRLVSFTAQISRAHGAKLARTAAKQVLAKSASPMETELAAIAFTSARQGGLGIPLGKLNEPVKLSPTTQGATGCRRAVADIYWEKARIAMEYDGRESHEAPYQQARDARKRDAFVLENIDTVVVTGEQLHNVTRCTALFDRISARCGKPKHRRGASHAEKHASLRRGMRKFHREHFS